MYIYFFQPLPRSLVNHFTVKYFTEDEHSDHWNISIQAVLDPVCSHWKESRPVIKTIKTSKRRSKYQKAEMLIYNNLTPSRIISF